jgi:ribosomal protein L40E
VAALECTIGGLASLDTSDLEAVMQMNELCLKVLLDPGLWAWMTGITLVCVLGGWLIGWIKGRVVAGIVWGAVLGPIGWLVVALSKSRLPICPECGKGNPDNARACRHCGVNLRQSAERSARSRLKGNDSDGAW